MNNGHLKNDGEVKIREQMDDNLEEEKRKCTLFEIWRECVQRSNDGKVWK